MVSKSWRLVKIYIMIFLFTFLLFDLEISVLKGFFELPKPGARNFSCGANYLAARWFNSACGAKLPVPGTKGGLFFICVESINLT